MSMDYIRRTYNIPARVGGRVEYSGVEPPRQGVICGTQGAHLKIRLDGAKHSQPYHPTWMLRYLDTLALTSRGQP